MMYNLIVKTIVEINGINYSSTGHIMNNIAKTARQQGYKVYTSCRKSIAGSKFHYDDQIYVGTWLDRVISERLAYITGLNGSFNVINTFLYLNKLNKIKPDLIHIHNLCDNYINVNMLFNYINKHNIPVIWTLHDAWAYTGRCNGYTCDKWKQACGNCPQLKAYPPTLFIDNSASTYKKRKKLYNSVKNLTIVTPSKWLADLGKFSFFKDKDIKVINNGINLDIFKPIESDFKKQYNIEDKYLVLGLAYDWKDNRKGLIDFISLSKTLPSNYQIILVGTNEEIDKSLPDNIISIHKTHNQEELAKIYTAVDVFVSPTKADNFPTVNIEALACGTPVITYDAGGSKESLTEKCGTYVPINDIEQLQKEIIHACVDKPYKKEECIKQSKKYNMYDKFNEYVELYTKIND